MVTAKFSECGDYGEAWGNADVVVFGQTLPYVYVKFTKYNFDMFLQLSVFLKSIS